MRAFVGGGMQSSFRNFQEQVELEAIRNWRPSKGATSVKWKVRKAATSHTRGTAQIDGPVAASLKLYSYVTGPQQVLFREEVVSRAPSGTALWNSAVDARKLRTESLPRHSEHIFHRTFACRRLRFFQHTTHPLASRASTLTAHTYMHVWVCSLAGTDCGRLARADNLQAKSGEFTKTLKRWYSE